MYKEIYGNFKGELLIKSWELKGKLIKSFQDLLMIDTVKYDPLVGKTVDSTERKCAMLLFIRVYVSKLVLYIFHSDFKTWLW